tara:strand:+ start:421 stop:672 length:252 start_codon:yes stop_codon:yes gene_type:complete
MNKYFELMNAARKKGSKSFKYNGNTYKASKTKTGLVVYKKSGSSATAKPMKAKKAKKEMKMKAPKKGKKMKKEKCDDCGGDSY